MRISDWSSDVCSSDLIYDVLRKYEPDHLLLKAAWEDARARMTDVGRLADLLERAAGTMLHVDLPRVSPLAVPVLILIGREHVAQGSVDDALLIEAEALAAGAMRRGYGWTVEPAKVRGHGYIPGRMLWSRKQFTADELRGGKEM